MLSNVKPIAIAIAFVFAGAAQAAGAAGGKPIEPIKAAKPAFTATENAQIVSFPKTLTGEQPKFALPILPPSTDATPRPQPF